MRNQRKIVVVDDDEMTLELIRYTLDTKGYDVSTAVDSIEAIKRIQENKPDLIILDIMLPDLSGLELLSLIRFGDCLEQAPVILISRMNDTKVLQAAEKLGAADYLTKPFEMDQLLDKISRVPGFHIPTA